MEEFTINNIVLGFLFAGAAHAAVLLWLLGHPARNEMKRTLCLWEGIGLLWHIGMGGNVVFSLNPDMISLFAINETVWQRTTNFLSVLTSMAVIKFIYAILQRDKGWIYKTWYIYLSGICLYALAAPSDWSSESTEEYLSLLGPLACYLYCIGLMTYDYITKSEPQRKMRIICTITGLGGALFLFIVFGKVLPEIMQFDGAIIEAQVLIFNGAWISTFVMIAAVKYGIVRMELDEIAEDIFSNMTDPVILVAPEGNIMRVNPAAKERFPTLMAQKTLPALKAFIPVDLLQDDVFETQVILSDDDSTFACTHSNVQRGGDHLGSILIMRDITKEKEVDRMKTELTSTVSHELRTPLTSVLGFTKLIQKRFQSVIMTKFVPENKKEERAVKQINQNLSVIISEGTRLTNLINDVLDISKMEAGKLDWNMQKHDLRGVIDQAVAAASGLFEKNPKVQLIQEISTTPVLIVDADRIIQVLLNLISNAVKFTDAGVVTIRSIMNKDSFTIEVKDEGIGITKSDCTKVFEKYKQVGEQNGNRPKGTGLGLPISKEIIEHHNGKIWVNSELGKGSTFAFYLPL